MRSSTLYIVMEYADGGDLASLIRQKKDSWEGKCPQTPNPKP